MTSHPRRRERGHALPNVNSAQQKIPNASGRRCPRPTANRRSRRAFDRTKLPAFRRPIPVRFYDIAKRKGFTLLERGRRSSDLTLRCHKCQQILQVRRSVVTGYKLQCNHCLWIARFNEAMANGTTIVTPHAANHKIAHVKLSCGHSALRQYGRLAAAARGGHNLGCDDCREARYADEAGGSGWTMVGPVMPAKNGYRLYQHHCGHQQSHAIVNVDRRQLDCQSCGESWASKPSYIYLFAIPLMDRTVLKLGYSSDPTRRLRYQLGDAARERGTILHVIDLPTGHAALKAEKKAHQYLRKHHPALVLPPTAFEDQIKTKTEIYDLEAKPVILVLMQKIAADVVRGSSNSAHPLPAAAQLPQQTSPSAIPAPRRS